MRGQAVSRPRALPEPFPRQMLPPPAQRPMQSLVGCAAASNPLDAKANDEYETCQIWLTNIPKYANTVNQ
jgi:hypothetical protein